MRERQKRIALRSLSPNQSQHEGSRTNDPERTKQDILRVATEEFARDGLSGARIDEIAARTKTSKRMIYYYFGSKEGLYQAVLEAEYRRIRAHESTLNLDLFSPLDALHKLIEFTFDFTMQNETFVRIVMIENIHHGIYLEKLTAIQQLSEGLIDNIRRFYERGLFDGVFRPGIDPIELHWQISALCFFSISNRPTFSKLFKTESTDLEAPARHRQSVFDMIERYVVRG